MIFIFMRGVFVIILVLFSLHSTAQRYGIEYENTFESTSPFQGLTICKSSDTSINQSQNVKYSNGTQSARLSVNVYDSLLSSVMRSQFIFPTNNLINYNAWYGMSFYLGDGYQPNKFDGYSTLIEFFKLDTEYLPPLLINYQGQFNYMTAVVGSRQSNGRGLETHWNIGSVSLKSWNDLIMNINWASDSSGFIKIWVNDTLRLYVRGPNNTTPNYMRIGVDKWDWRLNWHSDSGTSVRTLFIDELRVGNEASDYYSVRPGSLVTLGFGTLQELSAIKIRKTVRLDWIENTTYGFNKFEIQRSSDGFNFQTIGIENLTLNGKFIFIDKNPLVLNYYRIKKTDSRGLSQYGKTVVVKFDNTPAKNISVYDMTGKLVSVISVNDLEQFKLNSHLAHGVYVLLYDNGEIKKIVI